MKHILQLSLLFLLAGCKDKAGVIATESATKSDSEDMELTAEDAVWASGWKISKSTCGQLAPQPTHNFSVVLVTDAGDIAETVTAMANGDGNWPEETEIRFAWQPTPERTQFRLDVGGAQASGEIDRKFSSLQSTFYSGGRGKILPSGGIRLSEILPNEGEWAGKRLYLEIQPR